MYFHTDNPRTIAWLASVLDLASLNGQRVRFNVDEQGRLSVKRGNGVWSPPLDSTPDPYRDTDYGPAVQSK